MANITLQPGSTDEMSAKALDRVMTALGELFSAQVFQLPAEAATAVCEALEKERVKVGFEIELAPLKLTCSIRRGEITEPVFVVEGGYEHFAFAEQDHQPN